ncbi:MAG: hypothetical protein V4592_06580 [Bacteroidota bacterium]
MTFEEFFKKKKIDLTLLQSGEPVLFAEFKNHYNQMGEKSFDHTKKYWFNQLRRKYPAPADVKAEKVHIENQLAEQTITESLTEPAAPVPSAGFKPRFKPGMAGKPTEEKPTEEPMATSTDQSVEATPAPAVGFKPRFKAGMTGKPTVAKPAEEPTATPTDQPAETAPTPAVGFKPRFKAGVTGKPAEEKPAEENAAPIATAKAEEPATAKTVPISFKPKFRAAALPKVVTEEVQAPAQAEEQPSTPAVEEPTAESTAKPVGFKPRFNMNKMKPKEPGEE